LAVRWVRQAAGPPLGRSIARGGVLTEQRRRNGAEQQPPDGSQRRYSPRIDGDAIDAQDRDRRQASGQERAYRTRRSRPVPTGASQPDGQESGKGDQDRQS